MTALTQDMLDLLASGVAHQVGACTSDGRPVLCRGLAAQLEDDGRVAVIVSRESAFEVLSAIRENARISVNFTRPSDYRSFNLGGRDAVAAEGGARYRALVDERRKAFTAQLDAYGFPPEYTEAWYSCADEDLVAIRFTPISARDQTPGPGAGRPVELQR